MSRQFATITAVSGYVPDYVLTNKELEGIVDTNDLWITTRTGIKERRILKTPGKATSDMGEEIVRSLLEKSGTAASEIEMLICATITGDMLFPDTANTICEKSGLKETYAFDINAACSGFIYALHTAAQFIQSGTYKKIIVLGIDKMSSIVNYSDRTTCVIFGDGGGGVLVEPGEEGYGVIDAVMKGDGSGRQYLYMKAGGSLYPATKETVERGEHYVYQEGKPVFKAAVQGMKNSVMELLKRNRLDISDIDWLVPHQANIRIIQSLKEMLNFPDERVMINIEKYGNTTAGTLPLCLWDYEDQLKKGDNLVLTAFGGGFTWGSLYLKWAYGK